MNLYSEIWKDLKLSLEYQNVLMQSPGACTRPRSNFQMCIAPPLIISGVDQDFLKVVKLYYISN